MIRLDQVDVDADGTPVLPGPASFTVQPGRLLGISGTSGVGKTLLLRLLAGEAQPDRGAVEGVPAAGEVVWIPQDNQLATTLTALENVAVPLVAAGAAGRAARQAAERALEEVGLGEAMGQLVEELSGGQQQRVAIARAVAHPATCLLADEPTSALDAGNRRRMLQLLHEQSRAGRAVVVTTNDPESLEGVADEIVDLDAG